MKRIYQKTLLLLLIFGILLVMSCQENVGSSKDRLDPVKLAKMSDDALAYMRLSELHFSNGYRDYGLSGLKRAFIQNPYDKESFIQVTRLLAEEEDWETLVDFFNYAIEKYGARPELFRNVGVCYFQLEEVHRAAESFKKAVAMESTNPINYVYLAQSFEKLNKPEEALSTWKLLLIILNRIPQTDENNEYRTLATNNIIKLEQIMALPPI